MDTLGALCIIGFFGLLALLLLPRLLNGLGGGSPYSQRGPLNPEYDDPNIESRGNFGAPPGFGDERPTYDNPNIRSRGFFGRSRGSSSVPRSGGSSGRVDNPNIRSRGGFGRSK